MAVPSLKRQYIQVRNGAALSYGGSQMLSERETVRKCACGPVAALDLLLYLNRDRPAGPIALSWYNRELDRLIQKYFPLLPPFGINGLLLVLGLNRLLRERSLPYRAIWAASGRQLWSRVEAMVEQDLPVILAVGPNFPIFWQRHRLDFYTKTADGRYVKAAATQGHYVTATGIDEEWVRIASWGRQYFINRREYEGYVRKYSNYIFSNIVLLTHR